MVLPLLDQSSIVRASIRQSGIEHRLSSSPCYPHKNGKPNVRGPDGTDGLSFESSPLYDAGPDRRQIQRSLVPVIFSISPLSADIVSETKNDIETKEIYLWNG